ncbi:hypothetical protein ACFOMD_02015 [Sphingoaurantiacus capsulatus]|uniref:MarR family transcriptional regulator n=1 Tax=Sphingoaurantiacus capsulatus TaxID=1771310 RepID=A0ABV7X5Q8_9SPHN
MLEADIHDRAARLVKSAQTYVHQNFGISLSPHPAPLRGLPHFLLDRYSFWLGNLFGQPVLLMVFGAQSVGPVASLLKQRDIVRQHMGEQRTLLVIDHITPRMRQQLIEHRVAFLSPGKQLYVPDALIDLREHRQSEPAPPPEHLSPTAQLLLLASLLGHDVDDASLTRLADSYQVAIMSMSRAVDELKALEIAEDRRVGRQRRLRFRCQGRELWQAAETYLQSPVRKKRLVSGYVPGDAAPLAGESALAHYTMLAVPRIECRATPASVWKRMARHLDLTPAWAYDERGIEIETWTYDPFVLAPGNAVVDQLSLYLSIRHHPDERVTQAAEQMLEIFPW